MNILGFASVNHDPTLAMISDDEIKFHYEIERYLRIKDLNIRKFRYQNSFNYKLVYNKIQEIVEQNIKNVDVVALSMASTFVFYNSIFTPIMKKNINYDMNFEKFEENVISYAKNLNNFEDHIFFENEKIYFIDHHLSHLSYSFLTSPFEESDVLSYDGYGFKNQSLFKQNNKLFDTGINGGTADFFIGLLWVHGNMLYFNSENSPGKGMALSAYGKINYKLIELFDNIQEKYKNRLIGFAYGTHVHDIYNGLFSKHPVNIEDFYATLQYYSTELVVNNLKKYKSSDNLCLSGGCALNGYINEEILKRKIYKKIHIPPAVTDEGQSLGAALHALYILEGKRVNINNPNKIMYLGESYSVPEYIKENLKLEDDELYTFLAKKISEGYVIGWYQGRSESGPRALGNRSILADPRNPKMKDHINFKVKKREWYRPFAPSVLMEEASKWFILNGNRIAPYMTRILKYKKGKSKHVPATTHIDDTARIQTVTEEINPRYYKLIKEFFKLTNVPILLNTSFNGKNEPIVETPSNAFKCFQKNNIDILVLENNVYFRNGDKDIKPFIEESNVDGNDR